MNRKGFIVIYLNYKENEFVTLEQYVELARNYNSPIFEKLSQDGYETMLVPCFNESCRVEKFNIGDSPTSEGTTL